ncbi:MAG: helix-turn-helix domain-containing protein [Pirellulaceae bacterium]|nr:helix-turn-helix domain-containing protein [Pirellulaceae bacterium]
MNSAKILDDGFSESRPEIRTDHRAVDSKASIPCELITATQLADLLSISERTLYRLKSTGRLPSPLTLGGSVRWRLTDVRDWIAKGCPSPCSSK